MDDTPQDTQVIDAEVQESAEQTSEGSTSSNDQNSQATVFLSLENLVKGHISTLEKLQKEFSEQKEMLDNIFASDATFQQHSEAAKQANKVKSGTRSEILKRTDVLHVFNKMKSVRAEIAEQKTTLSELLEEFRRTTGQNQIEGEDGEIREIVSTAKLVKRSGK